MAAYESRLIPLTSSLFSRTPTARRRSAMTEYPWFRFDVAKERALMDTLTDEQYGAHMRLRLHAWTSSGIPDNEDQMRAIGRWTRGQWQRIWPGVVSRLWHLDDSRLRLVNDDLEAERLDVIARSESGRNAVAKRWQKVRNTPVERPNYHNSTEQDSTEREQKTLSLVRAREGDEALDLSPGQLQAAVIGLTGAWNNICAVDGSPFQPVTARSHQKATVALRAHPDIDWWGALFARVAASDFLRRDAKMAPADLWWVLDHAEEIAAGRYDNRAAVSKNEAVLARVLKDLA